MSKKKQQEQAQVLPVINVDEEDSLTTDEALAKISILLAESKNPKLLSELSEHEIKLCAALYVIGNKFNDSMILDFLLNFLNLRVSLKRKGRDELLQIAKSAREYGDHRMSRLRNLLSIGGRMG
jgi:hypothetical protein